MYKQTIQNIKVIILPIDGVIFDLNRFRYNYCRHYFKKQNIPIQKEDFYHQLSNMYDMYKKLPLAQSIDVGPFNSKIERELFQYLHYKGLKPKEGLLELIEYLHQKDIKIAALTTHHTKNAVEYLKLANIYNHFHFIIGSDTSSLPIPSTQILETISQFFQVENHEVLVISPFIQLNNAANQLHMNVIFCEDLLPAGNEEKASSYKTVSNLFEVLNVLLFDKYDDAHIYSPILGMDDHMSLSQINHVYDHLKETYDNDDQIMNLVDQTYEYHLSRLQAHNIKDGSLVKEESVKKRFSFYDDKKESEEDLFQNIENIEDKPEDIIQEPVSSKSLHYLQSEEDKQLSALLQQIKQKEKKQTEQTNQEESNNNLTKKTIELKEIQNEEKDVEDKEESSSNKLIVFLIQLIYTICVSFLIIFIGLIIYVAFIHQFSNQEGIFSMIASLYHIYYSIIENIFQFTLDRLHQFISFVPQYQVYSQSNPIFSPEGVQLLNIFIFNIIILMLSKGFMLFFTRRYIIENDR